MESGQVMSKNELNKESVTILTDIQSIIEASKSEAIRSVDFYRVQMYWKIGERIFVEEQGNKERAEYGTSLIKNLAKSLSKGYGSGFSERALRRARQFYQVYPKWTAVRSELNWLQYRLLSSISDETKRKYYELEAIKNRWTGRELERQINSLFYERLLLSSDKEAMMELANEERLPDKPNEIIKDPMVLEFLGLDSTPKYRESQLETALIEHLEEFLLELGNGFAFVARQKRITLEDDEFFVDLVFYNRLLKAHVIFEIKTHDLTHEDLGQLQMYVNYYDRVEKLEDENATIGILLCTGKNDQLVKFSLPEDNETILASKYQFVLPSEAELLGEIEKVEHELELEMSFKDNERL